MTTVERSTAAAEAIWGAWESGRLLVDLPEAIRPQSIAEGYAAQAQLARFGGPVHGWKIGATSKASQEALGVEAPFAGRLFERFVDEGFATFQATHMGVVEAEIAFRMACDLDSPDELSVEEVTAAVAAVHLAIEVPDSRFERFATAGGAQLVADDACAGRVAVGHEIGLRSTAELRDQKTAIRVDGAVVAEGIGSEVLGGPADALTWLANDLLRRDEHLAAGDLVMTGSTTVPAKVAPGSRVVAEFAGLGEVTVRFEA